MAMLMRLFSMISDKDFDRSLKFKDFEKYILEETQTGGWIYSVAPKDSN